MPLPKLSKPSPIRLCPDTEMKLTICQQEQEELIFSLILFSLFKSKKLYIINSFFKSNSFFHIFNSLKVLYTD